MAFLRSRILAASAMTLAAVIFVVVGMGSVEAGPPFARLDRSNEFTGAKNRFWSIVEVFHSDPRGFVVSTDATTPGPNSIFDVSAIHGEYSNPAGSGTAVSALASGIDATGVRAHAAALAGGVGVDASVAYANGIAIRGIGHATSGWTVGIEGISHSPDGPAGHLMGLGGGTLLEGSDVNNNVSFVIENDGSYIQSSSAALKTEVAPLSSALDKVERLEGVSFRWKSSGRADIGFVAEEVAEIVPEIVRFEADGESAQGLDYARMTALLVEAVKEQQAEIEDLKARLEELQKRR